MKKAPLVIVGLDTADPESVLNWARQGSLPAIGSMLERGVFGNLEGPEMISVHSTWLTFFSGVSIQQHGYYLSRQLEPGTYNLGTVDPGSLDAPPFWTQLSNKNLRALILDVPDFHPAPGINGYQIYNWGTHNTRVPCTTLPGSLISELLQISCPPMKSDESQRSRRNDKRILQNILQRVEKKGAICRHLLKKDSCDLAVVVFGDTHAASHRFQKYQHTDDALKDSILKVYAAVDFQIAQLLDLFHERPNVFVVSNSGVSDGFPIGSLMESFVRQLGYQRMVSSGFSSEWREACEHYLPPALRARSQTRRFGKGVDWERTTAFAIPAYYTGYLRVNLKGREPNGTVSPGGEYDAILDQLEADLRELADEETGEKVVERVIRTTKVFGGDPPLRLPDLFVDWHSSTRLSRRIVHPKAMLVQRKRARPRGNYHSSTGLFLAAGPDIKRRGDAGDFSSMDFAPLFRRLLNPEQETPLSTNASSLIT